MGCNSESSPRNLIGSSAELPHINEEMFYTSEVLRISGSLIVEYGKGLASEHSSNCELEITYPASKEPRINIHRVRHRCCPCDSYHISTNKAYRTFDGGGYEQLCIQYRAWGVIVALDEVLWSELNRVCWFDHPCHRTYYDGRPHRRLEISNRMLMATP